MLLFFMRKECIPFSVVLSNIICFYPNRKQLFFQNYQYQCSLKRVSKQHFSYCLFSFDSQFIAQLKFINYYPLSTRVLQRQTLIATMGICNERPTLNIQSMHTHRASSRDSFLYSSFTYDPTHSSEPNFFFFDLPHYCEIQYILRKKNSSKDSPQLQSTIQKHIEQIQEAIIKLKSKEFVPGSRLVEGGDFKKKKLNSEEKQVIQSYKPQSMLSEESTTTQYNNILNFQLVSISLNNCEDTREISFDVFLNNQKILTVAGCISENKWKSMQTSKISVPDINLELETMKKQVNIKVSSMVQGNVVECTIPCNRMTFKYIIPVIQTSNLRSRLDNEPIGHVHFKIQYVKNFSQHKQKVIADLEGRKKGLNQILQRLKNKDDSNLHDGSLILEEHNQSFRSGLGQD